MHEQPVNLLFKFQITSKKCFRFCFVPIFINRILMELNRERHKDMSPIVKSCRSNKRKLTCKMVDTESSNFRSVKPKHQYYLHLHTKVILAANCCR